VDGASDTTDEKRNVYRVLVRKPEGTRSFGRTGSRGENDIKV
jgi:predicted DNA-binding WGR domain protein